MNQTKLAERLSEIRRECEMALKFSSWGNAAPILRDRIPFLLEVIEKQRAALEFYASKGNWDFTWHDGYPEDSDGGECGDRIDSDDLEWPPKEDETSPVVAGKHARQAIAEVEALASREG